MGPDGTVLTTNMVMTEVCLGGTKTFVAGISREVSLLC